MFVEFLFTAEIFPLTGSKKGIEEMLDIKFVRENPEIVKQNIRNKFQDKKLHLVDEVIELDKKNREIKQEVEALRASRNKLSKEIGALMAQKKKGRRGQKAGCQPG